MELIDLVKDKEQEFALLYSRMDKDKDLIYNTAYQFDDYNGKPIPRSFNVTVPMAADFYKKVVSRLVTCSRQPIIKCSDNNFNIGIVENFILDSEIEVDNYLVNRGWEASFPSNVAYACARGICAEQHLWRIEGGVLIADTRPLDSRRLTFEYGSKNLAWAAYTMYRNRAAAEEEYGITGGSKIVEVVDAWDTERHQIFIEKKLVVDEANIYGYVPFCISLVNVGAGLREKDSISHNTESIFWPHRDMYDEINFIASVLKAHSFESIRPALQMPSSDGKSGRVPNEYPSGGSITPVEQAIVPMPRADMINSLRAYQSMIDAVIQKASLSPTEYGNVSFPMSAVALARLMSTSGDILAPRLQALGRLYQLRFDMIRKQCSKFGKIELGDELNKRIYDPKDLQGAYTVSFRYATETLEEMASRAAIAQGVKGIISDQTVRRTIMMLNDPDGEEQRIEAEEARRINPELQLFEQIHSLIDIGTEESMIEAAIEMDRLEKLLRSRSMGNVTAPSVEKKPAPTQTLPMANSVEGRENGKPSDVRL
jgi:hypothetical protein